MESKVSRRLQQATAQEVCDHIYLPRLNREFSSGFDYLSDINQAHLLMLARAGLMPRASAIGLAQALQQMERDGPRRCRWTRSVKTPTSTTKRT